MPKKTTISIPLDLARLLASEPDDYKDPTKYEDVQTTSRILLRLLIEANK